MSHDKKTPLHIKVDKLARKHMLTDLQKEEWSNLVKTAYMVGSDTAHDILTKNNKKL